MLKFVSRISEATKGNGGQHVEMIANPTNLCTPPLCGP